MPVMETLSLTDLGPIIAAIIGPMLLFVAALMRYQHVDSTKTRTLTRDLIDRNRDLIEQSNRDNRELIERTNRETRELIERTTKETRDLIAKNRDLIDRNRDLIEDTRQRCARIEGHLHIAPPPHQAPEAGGGTAEAA